MKNIIFVILLLPVICSAQNHASDTLSESGLDVKNGLFYKKANGKLFTGFILEKYPNGLTAKEGRFINGKLEYFKTWLENGKIKGEVIMVKGEQVTTEWGYKNNATFSEKKINGKLESLTEWFEGGQKKSEKHFVGGTDFFNAEVGGLMTSWYKNGQKEQEGNIESNKPIGVWNFWYENGMKQAEANYINEEELKATRWQWHENGRKKSEVVFNKYGEESRNEWDDEGKEIQKYNNGEKQGYWIEWRSFTGPINQEGNYKHGERDGLWIHYYPNGQKRFETNYVEGKELSEIQYEWHSNGLMKTENKSVRNEHGDWESIVTEYTIEGNKISEESNERRVEWYENGQKAIETTFRGEGVNTQWYENGQKMYEVQSIGGMKDGLYTSWYRSGVMESQGYYKEGGREGIWKEWRENGLKEFEITYTDGEETTTKLIEKAIPSVVAIGNQTWSTKNLDVSTFRNGDQIPEAKTSSEWAEAGHNHKPAWCYYDNDPKNGVKYGRLYNWYAVSDPRGLAPTGYHIPSREEWAHLTTYFIESGWDVYDTGAKMKTSEGWDAEGNGTNESGLSGVPAGFRDYNGEFSSVGASSLWWSSTDDDYDKDKWLADYYFVQDDGMWGLSYFIKDYGASVRCIID